MTQTENDEQYGQNYKSQDQKNYYPKRRCFINQAMTFIKLVNLPSLSYT